MKSLVDEIQNTLNKNEEAKLFLNGLLKISYVYLFGGGVRNYLDNHFDEFRDLDFVIKSKNNDYINLESYISKFSSIKYYKNRFGGYKINFNNIMFDIWNLEDTWLFKQGLKPPTLTNLIHSVYLNMDSLLYLLNEDKFIDDCDKRYKQILGKKIIDIVNYKTPCEELNLLRALVMKKKYSFSFSPNIKARFNEYLKEKSSMFIEELVHLQQEHYKEDLISLNELNTEINLLL